MPRCTVTVPGVCPSHAALRSTTREQPEHTGAATALAMAPVTSGAALQVDSEEPSLSGDGRGPASLKLTAHATCQWHIEEAPRPLSGAHAGASGYRSGPWPGAACSLQSLSGRFHVRLALTFTCHQTPHSGCSPLQVRSAMAVTVQAELFTGLTSVKSSRLAQAAAGTTVTASLPLTLARDARCDAR